MLFKLYWFCKTLFWRLFLKKIGLFSYFSSPVYISGGKRISIGNKVRIFPGARMETHHDGTIIFEDNISVGQGLHIISSGIPLIVKRDTTLSGNVFITNIDHDYKEIGVHILRQEYIVSKTEIGENCFIGYGAAIQAGTILGKQCVVGANSVVKGIFPDYSVIVGAPARVVKRYNLGTGNWEKTDLKGNFLNEN